MQQDRFKRLENLFHRAVGLEPDARDVLLTSECGDDPALRGEVRDLLQRDSQLGDPSGTAPIASVTDPLDADDAAIGPYRIVGRLGRGGMGVVYEARQEAPIQRTVALKLVRAGMDSAEVLQRFEIERQALALMEHPYVARIHDAGVAPDGRPFFAMERVDGEPINVFCERHGLGLDQKLELFARVCDAVHHAHQKGVIHRDLKPSNVLVRSAEEGPVPKVIDFGVAKAVDTRYGLTPSSTVAGEFVGTPEYMSPEQARLGNRDIDTRSDVYALGVMLYELLAGRHPYRRSGGTRDSVDEILEHVRTSTPIRPSTARESLPGPQDSTLARRLRGDLDWIVMRAMERDRERRYASAADLAADLRRHLRDEPVEAGPPSRSYRIAKFVRRHRAAVGLSALLLLTLVVAVVSVSIALVQKDRAERQARRDAEIAQRTSEFLLDLFKGSNLWVVGSEPPTVRDVADRAASTLNGAVTLDDEVKATLLRDLGVVYVSTGELAKARPMLEQSVELFRGLHGRRAGEALAQSLMRLAQLESFDGEFERSLEWAGEAEATLVAAGGDGSPAHGVLLGVRGAMLINTLKDAEAVAPLTRAVEILRTHRDDHEPELATALINLARVTPDSDRALELAGEATAIDERIRPANHPALAEGPRLMAERQYAIGDFQAAADSQGRAIEALTGLLPLSHWSVLFPARIHASYLLFAQRVDEARRVLDDCIVAVERDGGPQDPRIGGLLNDLAFVELVAGDFGTAERHARRSLAILEPAIGPDHADVALSLHTLGDVLSDSGDLDGALEIYDEVRRIRSLPGPLEQDPYAPALFEAYARARRRGGDLDGARADIERAIELYDAMPFYDPRSALRPRMTAATLAALDGKTGESPERFDAAWSRLQSVPGPLTMYDGRQLVLYRAVAGDRSDLLQAVRTALDSGTSPRFLLTEPELRRRVAAEPEVGRLLTGS